MSESLTFADLGLAPVLLKTLDSLGYETPTPIQSQAIVQLLDGNDVLGLAQTGTGKTAAFSLPLLSRIDTTKNKPQALVLCPTRELAIQVAEAFQTYARGVDNFHVLPIYGGADMRNQLRALKQNPQVIVGTPGRVMDHLRRGTLDLSDLKHLVLDEADEMLRMGFIEDIDWILEHTPKDKQTALFSATMPHQIKRITDQYQKDPVKIEIKASHSELQQIEQLVWRARGLDKLDGLTRILEIEDWNAIIIFVRTRVECQFLSEKLAARGYAATALSGEVAQKQREDILSAMKKGKLDIIIATDVAARGIDIERITHVINWDIPGDVSTYTHRIGRTGRAGRSGKAILFCKPREQRIIRDIERATKSELIDYPMPSAEKLGEHRAAAFKSTVVEHIEADKLDYFKAMITSWVDEGEHSLLDIAASMALMAQEDKPLQLPKDPEPRPRRDREDRPTRGESRNRRRDLDYAAITYRLDVGRRDRAEPGSIVGAIANEGGIEGKFINNIDIKENFTLVDLPDGMPTEIFEQLKKTRVKGRPLNLRVWKDEAPKDGKDRGNRRPSRRDGGDRKPRRGGDRPRRQS
ncbi:DEAD/DEAH box helicase [Reinekea blandensis]|uniref:ATP-dependent RNA helicase DeaD n=1 Tax=Reinekea blandensis MED297 TaxID=314283 RepID=A4BET4_9GAMM|nr:DEAD/DEAH box helicase [Reinekea blandensis]EAR09269.1 DEAD/DEAH box helicase-like protein [Reinekea sp. MED297] [Reinekea blandensis MED297]